MTETNVLSDPPVTATLEVRVKAGREAEFERGMHDLVQTGLAQPGHLGSTTLRPAKAGDPYRFIYKFDRRSNLIAWHQSETRQRLFAAVADTIDTSQDDHVEGLEAWFTFPGEAPAKVPPKWKTTLMTWTAIYPTALVISYGMHFAKFEGAIPLRVFVLTALVVPIVAYLVAPRLAKALHGWLHS